MKSLEPSMIKGYLRIRQNIEDTPIKTRPTEAQLSKITKNQPPPSPLKTWECAMKPSNSSWQIVKNVQIDPTTERWPEELNVP